MFKVYSKIFDLLSPADRRRFFVLFGLVLLLALLEALSILSILPFLQIVSKPEVIHTNSYLAWAYDFGDFNSDRSFMVAVGLAVFMLTVVGLIFKALMVWVLTRFATMRSYDFSARLLGGYLHQPYIWFLGRHSADLGQGILDEVNQLVSNVLLPALRLLPDLLVALMMVALLLVLEPGIAIGAAVLLGGVYGGIFMLSRKLLLRLGKARIEANKTRFHTVQEALGGIKELKLIGLEESFLTRFRHAAFRMAEVQTASQVIRQLPRFALEALAFGGMILLVLVLIIRDSGNLQSIVPTIGLIAAVGMRMIPALQQVYSRIATIRFSIPTLERIHGDILAIDPNRRQVRTKAEKHPALGLNDRIVMKDVHYLYPEMERAALNGLNLTIRANTTVGIVGGTGAGKTTLIDVILGLLVPQTGALEVDGTEITETTQRAWQKSIGYVPQQIFLSDGTVTENIAFGLPVKDVDPAKVERAARIAALHDFVTTELPDGYDTRVGERGVRLSGGQRQRIGIARALYHDPDVLILDEATSALDNLTEKAVMEAVAALAGSKTVIMIAHRLSTVEACDEIFLLRQGRVATSGTYQELIEQDTEFRAMAGGALAG